MCSVRRISLKERILIADSECDKHQHDTREAVAAFGMEVRSQGEGPGQRGSVEPLESGVGVSDRKW